jgi:heme-NO-binding protein
MKGIVFNLLEEVVTAEHGERTWDALLVAAGVSGAYSSLGTYPDEELGRIVGAASRALDTPPPDVVRWFGRKAIPLLARSHPGFFAPHRHTLDFLLTLNTIIHPEVRKLHPDAIVPEFEFETLSPGVLRIGYRSPRRLCALAEGFIEGAADHFGESVTLEHSTCMLRGDEHCTMLIRLAARKAA